MGAVLIAPTGIRPLVVSGVIPTLPMGSKQLLTGRLGRPVGGLEQPIGRLEVPEGKLGLLKGMLEGSIECRLWMGSPGVVIGRFRLQSPYLSRGIGLTAGTTSAVTGKGTWAVLCGCCAGELNAE